MSQQSDLEFLIEIRDRLRDGLDRMDGTQIEYAQEMIDDWIYELSAAPEVE